MKTTLSQELSVALSQAGDREMEVIDPVTQRTYVLVDAAIHRQAMDALRQQQDREAIAAGIAQMEAGAGRPLHEAFAAMRAQLGFPPQP